MNFGLTNLKFNSGLSFVDFNKISIYNYSSSLDNNSTEKLNFSSFDSMIMFKKINNYFFILVRY